MASDLIQSRGRAMWEAAERYHQVSYWAPEVRQTAEDAGLKGFRMTYFATRVAPLGPVPAKVVESLFFYYSPVRVNRAIPDAWDLATPEAVLEARYEGVDQALRRELGEMVDSDDVKEAAAIVRAAALVCDPMGRTLFAGWSSLEWPDEPHLALWHGCTLLREFRSGCHLLALGAAGLDGCTSVVSQVLVGEAPRDWIRSEAGWTPEEEAAATAQLFDMGWISPDGAVSELGREGRLAIEATTDRLDGRHWDGVGEREADRLLEILAPINARLPRDDQLDWREIYETNE